MQRYGNKLTYLLYYNILFAVRINRLYIEVRSYLDFIYRFWPVCFLMSNAASYGRIRCVQIRL